MNKLEPNLSENNGVSSNYTTGCKPLAKGRECKSLPVYIIEGLGCIVLLD